MQDADILRELKAKYRSLKPIMDERMRRRWAASEARAYGWGGIRAVSTVTGMSPSTIRKGITELAEQERNPKAEVPIRLRRVGGGRKRCTELDPQLQTSLEKLVEPLTRGDPESPLRWTCRSTTNLSQALKEQGHVASPHTVGRLLNAAGYSLQGNRKTKEGSSHPDRNAQFEYINELVERLQDRGQPVISVDTKKKELIGEFKNGGREWRRAGEPDEVKVHDFMEPELGKAIPYGVYDLSENQGWVSVGIDHDTARFATAAIGRWWKKMGSKCYPDARELLITADGGGSNSSRCHLWKVALHDLAVQLGIPIHVCHFPPGTSKWNKIEHRMFCHITQNWRGQPLISHEVIVKLIANTTTRSGLKIRAELDRARYPAGIKVTDDELAAVNIKRADFHGEWNYTLKPTYKRK
ncbi:MAG: ISAzo13 family transposase [Gammaproteobacteria bacterium]|nr:ISAzo13 family transposase [Gammaproteobacteria bacterium]